MVDARGYSCPMPVVMVQKEVSRSAPDQLEVLVDDRCAVRKYCPLCRSQRLCGRDSRGCGWSEFSSFC